MPRLPALYKQKKRWRTPEQADPLDYLECSQEAGVTWRRDYSSLDQWKDKALEVLHDHAARGQVLILPEHEARRKYPDLVVASFGAIRKDKPNGEVTARVLFDGTHGLSVNRRTRIRDQERSPIASDLKRALRERARRGERTIALSADVSEAHRQVPVHPQDWHLSRCRCVHPYRWNIRGVVGVVLLVPRGGIDWATGAIPRWQALHLLAYACSGRFYAGVWRTTI